MQVFCARLYKTYNIGSGGLSLIFKLLIHVGLTNHKVFINLHLRLILGKFSYSWVYLVPNGL